jgi:hypothetical protein
MSSRSTPFFNAFSAGVTSEKPGSLSLSFSASRFHLSSSTKTKMELIDGLQRLSTVFQLTGDLKGERAEEIGPLILNGTQFLPSLNGKRWAESPEGADDGIGQVLQIEIKRAR